MKKTKHHFYLLFLYRVYSCAGISREISHAIGTALINLSLAFYIQVLQTEKEEKQIHNLKNWDMSYCFFVFYFPQYQNLDAIKHWHLSQRKYQGMQLLNVSNYMYRDINTYVNIKMFFKNSEDVFIYL